MPATSGTHYLRAESQTSAALLPGFRGASIVSSVPTLSSIPQTSETQPEPQAEKVLHLVDFVVVA